MRSGTASGIGRLVRVPRVPHGLVNEVGLPLAVLVLFGVSGGMLWLVGYNYDGLTGNPITKIHPFTFLVSLLLVWRLFAAGDPVGLVVHSVDRRPAAALMLATALLALVVTVLRKGPGMAGFIDTYVGPAMLVFLLLDADARLLARLTLTLHALMTLNAMLALGEFVSHKLVFPYRFDGAVFPTDLRSTALQGHPLVNASITACYVLALLNGAPGLPSAVRLAMLGLQCAALVTYGGRSGMVIAIVMGSGYLTVAALRSMRRRRIPLLGAAVAAVLLALVPVALGALATGGFFDALLLRFQSDGGSANARIEMFDVVRALPVGDLLVGPDVAWVESLRRIHGLEWGIENPIIRLLLYQGAILTAFLLASFLLFIVELGRSCGRGVWLPVVACLLLLNTAESIGAKTTLVAKLAVIFVCLYPPRRDGAPRPSARRHPQSQ